MQAARGGLHRRDLNGSLDSARSKAESVSPVFGAFWYPPGVHTRPESQTGDDAGLLDNEDQSSASPEALTATAQPRKPRGRPRLSSREVVDKLKRGEKRKREFLAWTLADSSCSLSVIYSKSAETPTGRW